MEIVHLGHACVVLDTGSARLLVDPGAFSSGYETLEGLDAILVTHQHFDHLDLEKLPALMRQNPDAEVVVDPGTAADLRERDIAHTVREPGETFSVGGSTVEVLGGDHAVIHPDLPGIPNNGYLVDGTLLHPGDAWTTPSGPVEVLLLPTGAPWLKASEAVDYLRAVAPPLAVPIHEAVLADPDLHYSLFQNLAPAGHRRPDRAARGVLHAVTDTRDVVTARRAPRARRAARARGRPGRRRGPAAPAPG